MNSGVSDNTANHEYMLLRALAAVNKHQPKNKRNPMKRICIAFAPS